MKYQFRYFKYKLLILFYRLRSRHTDKNIGVQAPSDINVIYEKDLASLESLKCKKMFLISDEEKIIQKTLYAREEGSYSKIELFELTKKNDKELTYTREKLAETNAAIINIEKKIQDYSDKLSQST